ncbi:MAG TPA: MtrB/PioB family decaheme-associated outer membrane protein [Methylomirabilota bacterium]|nr:MtrB/PioB family decaheme-associated outer membrane protein [Methylomirabilota bacterium]
MASAATLMLALAYPARAETQLYGFNVEGEFDLGGRIYIERPPPEERSIFEQYRDLPEAPFGAFRFRLFRPDESYSLDLGGYNIGQKDQAYFLSTGRLGLWNFDFEWDQIPHTLSTDARSLYTEPSVGVFSLPSPRPPLSAYNLAPFQDVRTEWDVARFSVTVTPTLDLDLKADYTLTRKNGNRPLSMAFGSPGNNFAEFIQPIDQTIHDFRLRASYAGEGWRLQGSYALSIFRNGLDSLTAANPCFGLQAPAPPAGCGADATGAPASGRLSVAPNNIAHTISLAGAVILPLRTQLSANVSYSLRMQDDNFLPHTNNAALASSPSLVLPRSSLDGIVQTVLFNLNAVSRPLAPLTLTAKYRLYDLIDDSKELVFPGHVINDRSLVNEPRVNGQWGYLKQNAELDGRWRFGEPVALTAGGGWERWDRDEHREVPTSNEYFGKAALDVTPVDWFLGRLTYIPSFRRISEYNTEAHLQHSVVEEDPSSLAGQGQSVLLRKFDEGDRDRQRVDLMLQFTPIETLTISPIGGYRYDDYINSPLGLQKVETWTAGLDIGWSPSEWLSFSIGYEYEFVESRQQSRSREQTGTTIFDFADFTWTSKNVDRIQTVYAGIRATLIPKVLDWTVDLAYSSANGQVNTSNPTKPTSGTLAQQTSATAKPFPSADDSLIRLGTAIRYAFAKRWTATLAYAFEKFEGTDFRTDGLNPFVPGVTSIWLGSDARDYTAQYVTLGLSYRFD